MPGTVMRMRLEFHDEEGGKTRLVLTQGPYPAEWTSGATEGWGSSFTKLDKVLAEAVQAAGRRPSDRGRGPSSSPPPAVPGRSARG
jgi:hypothetical protein